MRRRSRWSLLAAVLIACFLTGLFAGPLHAPETARRTQEEKTMTRVRNVDSLRGKTVRWTFEDGPMPGTPFEHVFHEDGSVTWRVAGGPGEGTTGTEKTCSVVRVSESIHAISYLGASGHTLTAVLDFASGRLFGFASDEKEWHSLTGTFALVE